MKEELILVAGVLLCLVGVLSGTVTMRPHVGLQRSIIILGVAMMVGATIWAIFDPATWAPR
jgi:hypothetical protein